MKKLQIEKETAQGIYPESPDWFKKVLIKSFGKECFEKKVITDFKDIQSFAIACEVCGTTEDEFNERFNNIGLDIDTINYEKAKIVCKAINQGWKADYNDPSQKKWFPVFRVLSSGFGFSFTGYICDYSLTAVGSRLCLKDEARSNFAGTQFTEIFEKLIM